MSEHFEVLLNGEEAMVAFGRQLGAVLTDGSLVFLEGDLGAGKTTLSRGMLSAFGHCGVVKSPTYTLVEPYQLGKKLIYHFDLYRLGDPEELEYIGIRDYLQQASFCLVEWPERGAGMLPAPDLRIQIDIESGARRLVVEANTERGKGAIKKLAATS
ncbi:MAG: tRNA (adenosine(37)-N6)-threonylcarbamoyltransferase complex ATPase subunit type 1 TsaE [Gammaproteobacteria bacterium]|nr:MAG: tRNA (adenosine(37)-N6)-threonylcarbamoyltransferase complex ATPase subunit type 1 TsaE [Gammaproteobacteria bacterium]